MLHLIQRMGALGNAKHYMTYKDESWNGVLAKIAATCHRATKWQLPLEADTFKGLFRPPQCSLQNFAVFDPASPAAERAVESRNDDTST